MSVGNIESELERTGLLVRGAGAPTDSAAGYKVGAVYVDETNDIVYINTGTEASSIWKQMVSTAATQTLTGKSGQLKRDAIVSATGIIKGSVACQTISAAKLKALLVGTSTYNLFAVGAGDVILSVGVYVSAASTADTEFDIGIDATALGATTDPDGLLDGVDSQVTGASSSNGLALTTSAAVGVVGAAGPTTAAAAGYITITPGAKLSDDATFAATAYMLYMPA